MAFTCLENVLYRGLIPTPPPEKREDYGLRGYAVTRETNGYVTWKIYDWSIPHREWELHHVSIHWFQNRDEAIESAVRMMFALQNGKTG